LTPAPREVEAEAMSIASPAGADHLRSVRSSLKWTRYPADVLPLFVAEMYFPVSERVQDVLVERIRASDLGYIDSAGPLAGVFADFARERWNWSFDPAVLRVASDVSVGIVETLRYGIGPGSGVVVTSPVYPPFFELVEEAGHRIVDVRMLERPQGWELDLDGIEQAFAAGAKALLLCNPHNPLGIVHSRDSLERLGMLAARYDVLVISDEVHAPLTHHGVEFVPFLSVAGDARAVCVTSASKGWNLAGTKCAILVPSGERALAVLDSFPDEVACRASILGLHANIAAYGDTEWLDATISRIMRNDALLADLLRRKLPLVRYRRPQASYLGWLDFRDLGLGIDPADRILQEARVALNSGPTFGAAGRGHARINLACQPAVLEEAVERMAAALG
jgi:cystathionine beta-lyase